MNPPHINACFKVPLAHFELDVDLELPGSGITAVFGKSGSGKTTFLRCLAGLHKAKKGKLTFCGEIWQSESYFMPTYKRPIGYVFQDASLFPHLSVMGNLDFGRNRASVSIIERDLDDVIRILNLEHLLNRMPEQLSGGERQRVAIARALVLKPKLMLLDEPLASLDQERKHEIMGYLENLQAELGIPMFYVTHSTEEVTRLADHLMVLDRGEVAVSGELQSLLGNPSVIKAISDEPFTLLFGKILKERQEQHITEIDVHGTVLRIPQHDSTGGKALGKLEVRLRLYAKDISISLVKPTQTSILNIIECTIKDIVQTQSGGQCLVSLAWNSTILTARITAFSRQELGLVCGMRVFAQIKAVSVIQ